ncbi:P-loop NTPase superfamily protein [Rhizophagus clarus]|uniref:P-loop NTPase superfamily protein n=1 Tax=Rhizophagus clarus TaxID=94130 RepID=A0A8H3MIZ5_9GLOM|nr:P-loop NTPase superfamily protein [Rhizophagus clarus]
MNYTNYPVELVLSVGTRVMFLNNTQFKHGLYNGSIGIVMKICNQESIEVAFPLTDGIKTFTIQKDTVFFTFNAYVAMSRSPSWDKLDITSFNINSIKTDKRVLEEYNRLQEIYNNNISKFFT